MISRRTLLTAPALSLAQPNARPPQVTRILFGGDVILARGVARRMKSEADPQLPLRALAPLFTAADIAFVNLESPFSDKAALWPAEMVFRAEPATVAALTHAGIDIVSTANNHARDCGAYGIGFTIDTLRNAGIVASGTAATPAMLREGVVLERNGFKFGFLSYTYDQANGNHPDQDPRVAGLDPARMMEEVRALRRRTHAVIVSMHAGWEYWVTPNPYQIEFARKAIQAGAAVVAGHHPHVVQPVERYLEGVIFYSLGNLVFDQSRPLTDQGLLAEVTFVDDMLTGYKLLPVDIVDTVPRLSETRKPREILMRSR